MQSQITPGTGLDIECVYCGSEAGEPCNWDCLSTAEWSEEAARERSEAIAHSGRCEDCCYDAAAGIDSDHCQPCGNDGCDRYTDRETYRYCSECRAELEAEAARYRPAVTHATGAAYAAEMRDAGRGAQVAF